MLQVKTAKSIAKLNGDPVNGKQTIFSKNKYAADICEFSVLPLMYLSVWIHVLVYNILYVYVTKKNSHEIKEVFLIVYLVLIKMRLKFKSLKMDCP